MEEGQEGKNPPYIWYMTETWETLIYPGNLSLNLLVMKKLQYLQMLIDMHITKWPKWHTRSQLKLPVQPQYITKNWTDHRMHVEGPQKCQINR